LMIVRDNATFSPKQRKQIAREQAERPLDLGDNLLANIVNIYKVVTPVQARNWFF
jgi:hypothetical protein